MWLNKLLLIVCWPSSWNEKIDETDNYKYLGVYLSRNLKPTHHILKYLKENLENKLNVW